MAACNPWWYNETVGFAGCPYGRHLPGDVTLPFDASPIEWIAVIYSYIPWFIVAGVLLEFLYTRGTRQISVILFTAAITLANELVVKRLVQQPRPGALGPAPGIMHDAHGTLIGTCNISCGMPSSHATMAIGFLILTLYDGIIRVVPSVSSMNNKDAHMNRNCSMLSLISITPLSPKQVMDHAEFLGYFSTWMALLGPVPLMRVRLADHTATQVIIGSLLGAIYAALWFQLTTRLVARYKDKYGEKVLGGLLIHNYGPLAFRIQARPHVRETANEEEWKMLELDELEIMIADAPTEVIKRLQGSSSDSDVDCNDTTPYSREYSREVESH